MTPTKKNIYLALACILLAVFAFNTVGFAAESQKVDINSATKEELMTLKGIGEKVATNIIAHRKAQGPFKAPADIMNVKGVGEKTFSKNKDRIIATLPKTPMQKK